MGWCNPCPPGVPAGNFHLGLSWQAPASHCSPRNEAEKRGGQFRRPRGGVLVSCCCVTHHQSLGVFARGFCRSAIYTGSAGTANLCFGTWGPQLRRRQGLGCFQGWAQPGPGAGAPSSGLPQCGGQVPRGSRIREQIWRSCTR